MEILRKTNNGFGAFLGFFITLGLLLWFTEKIEIDIIVLEGLFVVNVIFANFWSKLRGKHPNMIDLLFVFGSIIISIILSFLWNILLPIILMFGTTVGMEISMIIKVYIEI